MICSNRWIRKSLLSSGKRPSSLFQCFFRISFRLHQKRHLEDARQRGSIAGEEDESGGSLALKKKRSSKRKKIPTTTLSSPLVVKKVQTVISTPAFVDVQVLKAYSLAQVVIMN